MEFRVEKGDEIYFIINNTNNGFTSQFWINTVEYVTTTQATWKIDNGFDSVSEMSCDRTQYYSNEAFDYVYLYQGTDPALSGKLSQGIYSDYQRDYTKYRMPDNKYAYFEGCVFAPQYHFSPGISFEAPFTGTVKFDYWYKLANSNHVLAIGKEADFKRAAWNWYTDALEYYDGATVGNGWQKSTIEVDVVAGEKVYFLIDNKENGGETYFWIKSAEYVYGDLNAQPATLLGVQESAAENGKFAVLFLSSLVENQYDEKGFVYSVKATKTDDGSVILEETDRTLTAGDLSDSYVVNKDGTFKKVSAPQNTKVMSGILEDLPADNTTVVINVYAYVCGNISLVGVGALDDPSL